MQDYETEGPWVCLHHFSTTLKTPLLFPLRYWRVPTGHLPAIWFLHLCCLNSDSGSTWRSEHDILSSASSQVQLQGSPPKHSDHQHCFFGGTSWSPTDSSDLLNASLSPLANQPSWSDQLLEITRSTTFVHKMGVRNIIGGSYRISIVQKLINQGL